MQIMSINTTKFWITIIFYCAVVVGQAQPDPNNTVKSLVTVYPTEKLDSRVYPWVDASENLPISSSILASGSTTHLESLKISAVKLAENQFISGNEKESEQLIIVKEGQISIEILKERKELGPGSVALILPGDNYRMKNLRSNAGICYVLKYQSKAAPNMARGKKAGGSFMVDWNEIAYREHSKGGRRDFFDRPTAMCADFEMHVTNLNLNTSSHAPHTHEVEEIILMVQGNISMHIDGTETAAGKGDFAFVDSNVPHAPTNIGDEQAIYFAFQWK